MAALEGKALKDYEWQFDGDFEIEEGTVLASPKMKVVGVNYRTESRQFMMEVAFYEVQNRHIRPIVQTLPEGDESIDADKIIYLIGVLYPTATLVPEAQAK